ncbi:hypothetical protein AMR41_29120 [Hapalosiphon sp. MRB220]|nr:hypothetical protein AMR41_29120 [Hapalosiphon sp. MRB220]
MKTLPKFNVLVIGNTGVGKSTLISALFQVTISKFGTKRISDKPYTKPGLSINIYDTPGLERDKKQCHQVKKDIAKFIQQENQKEPEDQIHVVWYCINSQVTRESDIDQQWIQLIANELPVIAVITRASGSEKDWLEEYLESDPNIQDVVSVMAKPETNTLGKIESYGLESLLNTTIKSSEKFTQKAILNALNAKASKASPWYRDGCLTVLAIQLSPIPIPIIKATTTLGLQVSMLAGISKTFGYHFDHSILKECCVLATRGGGLNLLFEKLIAEFLKAESINNFSEFGYSIPTLQTVHFQTVQDVLNYIKEILENSMEVLPFKEKLSEFLTSIGNLDIVSGLPILSCLNAIITTISTGILAFAYIETMKKYKQAEYEGQPRPELKFVFAEQIQILMELISQLFGQKDSPSSAT